MAAAAISAVSCIYPFTPEAQDGSGTLVVEGDILLGEFTVVDVSYTRPVDSELMGEIDIPHCSVWVEDDRENVYPSIQEFWEERKEGKFRIDTRNAPADRRYRLHIKKVSDGREYVSEWGEAPVLPEIDSLSYNLDFNKSRLNVALSMHSNGGSFFRWTYVEDWEFHADYNSVLKYTPPQVGWWGVNGDGSLEARPSSESTYYCYGHEESSEIMIFSTENQTDDRFVDLEFRPIPRDDPKISYIYHIDVALEPLTEDAYRYWENIKANSEYNGSLFAPNPSELVGNIRCVEEPNEMVMGYISVARMARKDLFIRHTQARFYKDSHVYEEPVLVSRGAWYDQYKEGYLPFSYYQVPGDVSQTYWARSRCVDCRLKGKGTYTRPSGWNPDGRLN